MCAGVLACGGLKHGEFEVCEGVVGEFGRYGFGAAVKTWRRFGML